MHSVRQPRDFVRALGSVLAATLALLVATTAPRADTVLLEPVRDNSIYEELDPNGQPKSNGAGEFLFSGRNGQANRRRALMAFDVSSSIPAGSTIVSVQLTLACSNAPGTDPPAQPFTLYRLDHDWGEGSSNSGPGGFGIVAQPGDATWPHRFYDPAGSIFWGAPGGDFVSAASATSTVGACDFIAPTPYGWSSAQMAADVQSWLTDPSGDHGWILVGFESALTTARRFGSRESPNVAHRPRLTVEYAPPLAGVAGQVPNGDDLPGVPLSVARLGGGDVRLDWGSSCRPADEDYAIYEGRIGEHYSHAVERCSTGGNLTATLAPAHAGSYFLVVPVLDTVEGSYGRDSDGAERPAGAPAACFVQTVANPICP